MPLRTRERRLPRDDWTRWATNSRGNARTPMRDWSNQLGLSSPEPAKHTAATHRQNDASPRFVARTQVSERPRFFALEGRLRPSQPPPSRGRSFEPDLMSCRALSRNRGGSADAETGGTRVVDRRRRQPCGTLAQSVFAKGLLGCFQQRILIRSWRFTQPGQATSLVRRDSSVVEQRFRKSLGLRGRDGPFASFHPSI